MPVMDPTTTLITFMIQTAASVPSVQLVGSWDNFNKRYPMQRDARRGHGQWRGCYSFKDIICDGDGQRSPKRDGGLKMGRTYWYYYELGDGTEIHDPTLPSTASSPFLPGQQVNQLYVPVEVTPLRERSASVGAVSQGIKTMNPDDKYLTPRPPPAIPRLNTSPSMPYCKRSARSASPKPRSPWSAVLGLKSSSAHPDDRGHSRMPHLIRGSEKDVAMMKPEPIARSSESRRARPIPKTVTHLDPSLDLLGKALPNEVPWRHHHAPRELSLNPSINAISDEILEECDDEDDGNFATVADVEKSMITCLSPPFSRKPSALQTSTPSMKPLPLLPAEPSFSPSSTARSPSSVISPRGSGKTARSQLLIPRSHFSIDTISDLSPTESQFSNAPSISNSYDEEDADAVTEDSFTFAPPAQLPNSGAGSSRFHYSLPREENFYTEPTTRKATIVGEADRTRNTEPEIGTSLRINDGAVFEGTNGDDVSVGTALDRFLVEMGYLGGSIVGSAT